MRDRTLFQLGELCRRLSHHGRRFGRRIAGAAAARCRGRSPDPGPGIGLAEYQVLLAHELDRRYAHLVACHDRRLRDREILGELRRGRDVAVMALRQTLIRVSDALKSSYPPRGLAQTFLRQFRPLPAAAEALLYLAERFRAALIDPRLELGPPRMGVEVDLAVVTSGLEAPMRGLGEVLTELPDAEAAERFSGAERSAALEEARSLAGKVSRYYQALADLAGDERLARRLRQSLAARPASHSPRRTKRPGIRTPAHEVARITGT